MEFSDRTFSLILRYLEVFEHTGYPGLWTQVLDARLRALDAGLWTWTLDFGRSTLDAGIWALGSGHWTLDTVVDWFRTESVSDFDLLIN